MNYLRNTSIGSDMPVHNLSHMSPVKKKNYTNMFNQTGKNVLKTSMFKSFKQNSETDFSNDSYDESKYGTMVPNLQ